MKLTFSEMKKILLIYASAMMVLCAVSCDKDKTGSSANKLVKEISSGSYRITFEYDGENRLTKVVEQDEDITMTSTFTYDGNTITETLDREPNFSYQAYTKYYLDNDGYLTRKEDLRSGTAENTMFEYENGLLKAAKSERFESEYEWENGDIVVIRNGSNYEERYEYTNFEDNLNVNFLFGDTGEYYLNLKGIFSQHLPKTCTVGNPNPSYTYTTEFAYEFDDDGRVSKIIMTDRSDSSDREECNIIYY